ncbi:hypothetical protein E2C01_007763 [Portunus trituberculatus]|uniref:Uncharacterized protein n=1 Tax=Portunus trituberculatus TaxID=210409 RepID=A0A5B7D226_PORTR|nr:hypothetical protein [Portunus trituberculatus]
MEYGNEHWKRLSYLAVRRRMRQAKPSLSLDVSWVMRDTGRRGSTSVSYGHTAHVILQETSAMLHKVLFLVHVLQQGFTGHERGGPDLQKRPPIF